MKPSYRMAIMNVPVLYIVRHGATGDDDSFNSPVDAPLDEQGTKQAKECADWFIDKAVGRLLTSDKKRAIQTAEAIGKIVDRQPIVDIKFDSLDVGDVANMSSAEEADRTIKHHQDNPEEKIPGGESIADFRRKVQPEFQSCIFHYFLTGLPDVVSAHQSIQHEAGNFFNDGDIDSAISKPGGVVAVYQVEPGKFKAVPVFKPE